MLTSFLLLASLAMPAYAADADALAADDDSDLFSEGENRGNNAGVPDASSFNADDDLGIPTFSATVKAPPPEGNAPKGPARMPLADGKEPLADHWAPQVVYADASAVVVEIPVLYANDGAGFDGQPYWLVAEAYAGGRKVAESRMQVTKDAIAQKGASVQFFRLFVPVPAGSGVLELKVGKAADADDPSTLVFARSVNYTTG